jgi:hypothetical protein
VRAADQVLDRPLLVAQLLGPHQPCRNPSRPASTMHAARMKGTRFFLPRTLDRLNAVSGAHVVETVSPSPQGAAIARGLRSVNVPACQRNALHP